MLSRAVLLRGTEEAPPERRSLRAGPLTALFEDGDLRAVRLGDREILRRVYVAVRDRNWGTVPRTLTDLRIEDRGDSFRVSFRAVHRQGDIDFAWEGALIGEPDGALTFRMEGRARSTFLRNRIGFCVLHPIRECAGAPCVVEHVDGSLECGVFPAAISPHQPFLEIRSFSHRVAEGLWAEVRYEGEVFEMEDQRNWTDASYKTYGTPLRLPFPVTVHAGERAAQSVTLRLKGRLPEPEPPGDDAIVRVEVGSEAVARLRRLGLGAASHGQPLSAREVERLRRLRLSHLRVDLSLGEPGWAEALRRAAAEARALGARLEAALTLTVDAESELEAVFEAAREERPPLLWWLVFHAAEKSTRGPTVRLAREILARHDPSVPVGAGTRAYFAELNRERPPVQVADLVCYSVNPQVHAFDDASLVETPEAIAETVRSARRFLGGVPLAVTPVTLRRRFNPDATGPEAPPAPGELPYQVDPRQMSLLGAGWTVASLKALAESGADSVTYYETTGWRGVMERESGSELPERFPSIPGSVFPLYHVLADAAEMVDAGVLPTASSAPLRVQALALRQPGRLRLLVANLTPERQEVQLSGLPRLAEVRMLDEETAPGALLDPEAWRQERGTPLEPREGLLTLDLAPYAVARVDASP